VDREPAASAAQCRLERLDEVGAVGAVRRKAILITVMRAVFDVQARVALLGEFGTDVRDAELRRHRHVETHQQTHAAGAGIGQRIGNALRAVATHRLAATAAVQRRGTREQQLEVIVDLGHRADRGARLAYRVHLVDRDGRRNALDAPDLRLVHAVEELPRVGREGLDVAPLPLGVQRIEHQRGLAGTRHTGHDQQLAAADIKVDVAEVVLARAAHGDQLGHAPDLLTSCRGGLCRATGLRSGFREPRRP
jgi:hypothetical protein